MTVHEVAALTAVAMWATLAGCDTTARTASSGTEAPTGDRRSREHETCSRSADCAGDLRCFDGVCRRGKLSTMGDLYAAVGDRALTAGQAAQASDAYGQALSNYEQEKIDPPASLLCSLGSALTGEPSADKQKLERAARLLHRCLNGSPPGSFLRSRALADLAGADGSRARSGGAQPQGAGRRLSVARRQAWRPRPRPRPRRPAPTLCRYRSSSRAARAPARTRSSSRTSRRRRICAPR